MIEPGWISFHAAAMQLARDNGTSEANEQARLRQACGAALIRSMKAPCWELGEELGIEPFELWNRVPPSDWRNREVDYDPPNHSHDANRDIVMLNEDDLKHWRDAGPKPSKPRSFKLVKRDTAKEAIEALWPDGLPNGVVTKEIIQKVSNWLKAQKLSPVGPDTIRRAAGRK